MTSGASEFKTRADFDRGEYDLTMQRPFAWASGTWRLTFHLAARVAWIIRRYVQPTYWSTRENVAISWSAKGSRGDAIELASAGEQWPRAENRVVVRDEICSRTTRSFAGSGGRYDLSLERHAR
jgi:hypothetical protein